MNGYFFKTQEKPRASTKVWEGFFLHRGEKHLHTLLTFSPVYWIRANEIAKAAFGAAGKPLKITHIPIWIRNLTLGLIRFFTDQKIYGTIEFFMTVMTQDMVALKVGQYHLAEYHRSKAKGTYPVSSLH